MVGLPFTCAIAGTKRYARRKAGRHSKFAIQIFRVQPSDLKQVRISLAIGEPGEFGTSAFRDVIFF
jgi:hypothetical protein